MQTLRERNVSVTIYRDEKVENPKALLEQLRSKSIETVSAVETNPELISRREICERLGLSGQVDRIDNQIHREKQAAEKATRISPKMIGYMEIVPADMKVWESFLPTEIPLKKHTFDDIPVSVLQEIDMAHCTGVFTAFTVRTPEGKTGLRGRMKERKLQDPILIGWDNQTPYLLARWAESLQPFSWIKARTFFDKHIDTALGWLTLAALVSTLILSLWAEESSIMSGYLGTWLIGQFTMILGILPRFWSKWNDMMNDTTTSPAGFIALVSFILGLVGAVITVVAVVTMIIVGATVLHWILLVTFATLGVIGAIFTFTQEI